MAGKLKIKASETSPEILMLGYLCIKDTESISSKINILDRFGLADIDIATICDCEIQSVRNARQKVSKKAKR